MADARGPDATPTSPAQAPAYVPADVRAPPDLVPFHLNGTQNMLRLFDLMPLYDRAVRPYLRPSLPAEASEAERAAALAKRTALPKTFAHYVEDLPGKVRPAKRAGAAKHQPGELSMLLAKPEYTYTPVVPFDADALASAFTVAPSTTPVPHIDLTQLESEPVEMPAPKRAKAGPNERTDPPKKRVVLISKKKRAP